MQESAKSNLSKLGRVVINDLKYNSNMEIKEANKDGVMATLSKSYCENIILLQNESKVIQIEKAMINDRLCVSKVS